MNGPLSHLRLAVAVWMVCAFAGAGCGGGSDGPPAPFPTVEVKGKLVYKDGRDVAVLDLAKIWFQHTAKPEIQAVGSVGDDGTFVMTALVKDKTYAGVPEGTYKVRVEPPRDEDTRAPRYDLVHLKYQSFDKSGLRATVPLSGELIITVEPPGR